VLVVLSSCRSVRPALLLNLVAGALTLVRTAGAEGDPEQGRKVAERWCARCHVIGDTRRYAGIDSSPSFFLMHDKLDDYRPRLLSFQKRRPHLAQELDEVARADIEHLIAYIAALTRPE
jgi:mono/diheme cytochrome c family protein